MNHDIDLFKRFGVISRVYGFDFFLIIQCLLVWKIKVSNSLSCKPVNPGEQEWAKLERDTVKRKYHYFTFLFQCGEDKSFPV
jgi:hypothetical protein